MDENRKEELLTRWIDGVLSEAEQREWESYLAGHPELETEREAFQTVRAELRAAVPAKVEPPYPDFFNAHLERLIRESRSAVGEEAKPAPGVWRMLSWWLAPAAAAALVLAFFLGMQIGGPQDGGLEASVGGSVPAVYSPIASVEAAAVTDKSFGGTVIVLEGLDAIPSSVDLFQASTPGRAPGAYYISTGTLY